MNRFNVDQGTSGLSASVEMEGPSRRSLASMASMASMASIASMVVVEIHEVSANDHPVRTIIEVVAMKRKGKRNEKDARSRTGVQSVRLPLRQSLGRGCSWGHLVTTGG